MLRALPTLVSQRRQDGYMALPGQRGATNPQNADEVAALHALIVHLKLTHPQMTWRQIGYATHYHWKYCQTIFYKERAKSSGAKLVEQHVVEILEELDELAEQFRPFVTRGVAGQQPPPKRLLDLQLKIIDRKARWSGASSWARRKALASRAASASGTTSQSRSSSYSVVEARHRQVIELRLNNPHMTWKEIGLITSFHPNYCSLIFAKAHELAIRSEALEGYRQQILDELEAIADRVRQALSSESAPDCFEPEKDHVDALLKILERKVKLLGLDLVVSVEDEVTPSFESPNAVSESGTSPERRSDGTWAHYTSSQLLNAGLLDIEERDGKACFVRTEKGRVAGFDFSPGWSERWKDVYVGFESRHWEFVEKHRAKEAERRRWLRELCGLGPEPVPYDRGTMFGAEADAQESDNAEAVSTVEPQQSQRSPIPDWILERIARRDGKESGS